MFVVLTLTDKRDSNRIVWAPTIVLVWCAAVLLWTQSSVTILLILRRWQLFEKAFTLVTYKMSPCSPKIQCTQRMLSSYSTSGRWRSAGSQEDRHRTCQCGQWRDTDRSQQEASVSAHSACQTCTNYHSGLTRAHLEARTHRCSRELSSWQGRGYSYLLRQLLFRIKHNFSIVIKT